jgi:hypothetical protein
MVGAGGTTDDSPGEEVRALEDDDSADAWEGGRAAN